MNVKQFFILGAQRSGTTLLRLLLNAHSEIGIPRESTFLMPLLTRKNMTRTFTGNQLQSIANNFSTVKAEENTFNYFYNDYLSCIDHSISMPLNVLLDDMFTQFLRYEGKQIWGNKTPSFFRKIDILYRLFPDARFIHIVRDGRDVFHSWRKLDPTIRDVVVAAIDWQYKLSKIEKSLRRIPDKQVLVLRYEDLLDSPRNIGQKICSFLTVDFEDSMLKFYETSYQNTISTHSELIFKPLDPKNKFKWRTNLGPQEIRIYTAFAKNTLDRYKYDINTEALSVYDLAFILRKLLYGIPIRILQVIRNKQRLTKMAVLGKNT